MFRFYSLILFIFFHSFLYAQKVGLVLSGGGAKGLAHIGVIKALEENGIPIDYITGTSMGAIVGSLYAAGFSPQEMENIVTDPEFQNWAWGKIPDVYVYYFKRKEEDASWIDLKFKYDSVIAPSLPTNIVPPHSMDLAFMQLLASASAKANYNFDSLFVPFRCVASDVYANEPIIFKDGDLGSSVRASMTFPFYFKPITIKGRLLFDGGIYNNFPIDVMQKDFNPDYIIGSCVASNSLPPSDDNILLQIENMIVSNTNYRVPDSNGILIEPDVKMIKLMDFYLASDLIKIGYGAAMAKINEIKKIINVRVDSANVNIRRAKFNKQKKPLYFKNIYISGLTYNQSLYLLKNFLDNNDTLKFDKFRKEYYKLVSDEQIESIFPRAKYNENTGLYNLFLNVKREKPFGARIGGLISSDNLNEGFLGVEYKYFTKVAISLNGNIYFGKFYSSLYGRLRIDNLARSSFYWQSFITMNRYDYYRGTSFIFYEDNRPLYILESERNFGSELAFPIKNKAKFNVGIAFNDFSYRYYQSKNFSLKDTSDNSAFYGYTPFMGYERNTLNHKNFATSGHFFKTELRYYDGMESYMPGSTSNTRYSVKRQHKWFYFNIKQQHYISIFKYFDVGLSSNVVLSNQPLFSSYTASLLMCSAYQPTFHASTIYIEQYRNPSFAGAGISLIYNFTKNLHWRIESHHFVALNPIVKTDEGFKEDLSKIGNYAQNYSSSFVFISPVANISLSVNYYPWHPQGWFGQFNIGYLIFNRSLHP